MHLVRQVGFGLVLEQQPHDRLVAVDDSQGQACGSALQRFGRERKGRAGIVMDQVLPGAGPAYTVRVKDSEEQDTFRPDKRHVTRCREGSS